MAFDPLNPRDQESARQELTIALQPLAKRVADLQKTQVPLNPAGLPSAYINSGRLSELTVNDDPALAMELLDYSEGFPCVRATSLPFWERLENEPDTIENPCYSLFKRYRELPLAERTTQRLAELTGHGVGTLMVLSQLYHWRFRAQAHDQYKQQVLRLVTQEQILVMENKHAKAAQDVFEICTQHLKDNQGLLTPKVALEWLKYAVELERMSYGMDPKGQVGAKGPDGQTQAGAGGLASQGATFILNQQINAGGGSEIKTQAEDQGRITEILQILSQSGALRPDEDKQPTITVVED